MTICRGCLVTLARKCFRSAAPRPVFSDVALKTFDHPREPMVPLNQASFTKGFFISSPSDVTTRIGVGCSDHQRTLSVFLALENVTGFGAFDFTDLTNRSDPRFRPFRLLEETLSLGILSAVPIFQVHLERARADLHMCRAFLFRTRNAWIDSETGNLSSIVTAR